MIRGRASKLTKRTSAGQDRGAAAVEFALLLPFLLLLVSGAIAFGLSLWIQINAAAGGREAARLAAVGVDNCTTWADQVRATVTFPDISNLKMTIAETNGRAGINAGDTITATFDYDANFAINDVLLVATGLFGGGVQLPESYTETSVSRAEQVDITACAVP